MRNYLLSKLLCHVYSGLGARLSVKLLCLACTVLVQDSMTYLDNWVWHTKEAGEWSTSCAGTGFTSEHPMEQSPSFKGVVLLQSLVVLSLDKFMLVCSFLARLLCYWWWRRFSSDYTWVHWITCFLLRIWSCCLSLQCYPMEGFLYPH